MPLFTSNPTALVGQMSGARVMCVGDVMLDVFIYGSVDRVSPEAPIAVLAVEREDAMLGGSGNVVRNLVAVGAEVCFLAIVGDDMAGRDITALIGAESRIEPHLLVDASRCTTIKTRFVAGVQQLLRADRETATPPGDHVLLDLASRAEQAMPDHKVLVLSDYGKGVLEDQVCRRLIDRARALGVLVIVDPKGRDYARYAGATLITPNRRELHDATGLPVNDNASIIDAARYIMDRDGVENVLVTRSRDGMTLVEANGEVTHFDAEAREVFDVAGAGDTVVSSLAAALAGGVGLADACRLANIAAGIVVGKIGTAVAHAEEIVTAIKTRDMVMGEAKIAALAGARDRIATWRRDGLKVGFTNGCFDLLHPGHVSLIAQARAACDRLIVGINSDASVKRLKGPDRPIQNETARATVLAALGNVDMVTIFDQDTPYDLINELRPDVLVKGADYRIEDVVGADLVQGWGGSVHLAKLTSGQSTTATVSRIRASES
jgi:D-beta-D-heptose 7-phosphate kinase/D-beta-D-heptose 1-phosphate adenosyltransferase